MSDMEICFDESTVFVQPDEPPMEEVAPVLSKTASRRTVAKYLKRRTAMSTLIAKEHRVVENIKSENMENDEDKISKQEPDNSKVTFQIPYFSDNYNQDVTPMMFSPKISNFMSNNLLQQNKENSSISDMLKCVLDCNKGFIDSLEMNNDFSNPWLANGLPFDCYQSHMSGSGLSASLDKQEREIAYNLLLRRIIDDTLDRNIIFSHQPKELLNLINTILVRQFPEYEDSKHRSKVRSYLKACRRNSKKNYGRIIMKNTAAYLSSGPGNRLMHQIYNSEKEMIDLIKKESEKFKSNLASKQSQMPLEPVPSVKPMQQQILNITNNLPQIIPISMHSLLPNIKPLSQIYTSKAAISVNQLPLLLPLSNSNTPYEQLESAAKPLHKPEPSASDEVFRNIPDINFVSSGCNLNIVDLINQLNSTASFLVRFAETLEKSYGGSGSN